MKITSISIAVLLLAVSAFASGPEAYLQSAPMPFYPSLGRTAHISGKVEVHYIINEQGETTEIKALGGHGLLQKAAIENVQGWKFVWTKPCACRKKEKVLFVFNISDDWVDDKGPSSIVKWFGKSPAARVEIQARAVTITDYDKTNRK